MARLTSRLYITYIKICALPKSLIWYIEIRPTVREKWRFMLQHSEQMIVARNTEKAIGVEKLAWRQKCLFRSVIIIDIVNFLPAMKIQMMTDLNDDLSYAYPVRYCCASNDRQSYRHDRTMRAWYRSYDYYLICLLCWILAQLLWTSTQTNRCSHRIAAVNFLRVVQIYANNWMPYHVLCPSRPFVVADDFFAHLPLIGCHLWPHNVSGPLHVSFDRTPCLDSLSNDCIRDGGDMISMTLTALAWTVPAPGVRLPFEIVDVRPSYRFGVHQSHAPIPPFQPRTPKTLSRIQ